MPSRKHEKKTKRAAERKQLIEQQAAIKESHGTALQEEKQSTVESKLKAAELENEQWKQDTHQSKLDRDERDSLLAITKEPYPTGSGEFIYLTNDIAKKIDSYIGEPVLTTITAITSCICRNVMFEDRHEMMVTIFKWASSSIDDKSPQICAVPPAKFDLGALHNNEDSTKNNAAIKTVDTYYPNHSGVGHSFDTGAKRFSRIDSKNNEYEDSSSLSLVNYPRLDPVTTFHFVLDFRDKTLTAFDKEGSFLDMVDIDGCPLSWACYMPKVGNNIYKVEIERTGVPSVEESL